LISRSEIEELVGLCDRYSGHEAAVRYTDCLERSEFDRERMLRSALGEGSADEVQASPGGPKPRAPRSLRRGAAGLRRAVAEILTSDTWSHPDADLGHGHCGRRHDFVLLTAGVDLSVGATMFVRAAVAASSCSAANRVPGPRGQVGLGLLLGAVNGFFITKLRIVAFMVTLATLFVGRGFAFGLRKRGP